MEDVRGSFEQLHRYASTRPGFSVYNDDNDLLALDNSI